ncbi:hypothetical protein [Kordia sp.]|uniref:hypothetical protein n=1 Tax=Kordia sp. TaxID=1965332 RepID=UPI003B5C23BF
MKKKKLKSLSLKKASVSNLNGGSGPFPIPLSRNLKECAITYDIYQCTWYSELGTACSCPPSWDLTCTPV